MNVTSSPDSAHTYTSTGGALQDSVSGWRLLNVSVLAEANATLAPADEFDPLGGHTVWQVIIIVFLTGSLSLMTVVGNILVLVSFKVNKALKTVNNYYLLSLAMADLTIGTLSMNLYTTYIIMDTWALGPLVCDLWLAIDYVASNASVMNLLVISFDRYFSVTRPLTYRAKRTTKRAMTMICLAWSTSFILWAPAILFWQYIVGERTVQPNECYIQFLSEPVITFCTAIAAFYLPVSIMAFLFWQIFQTTEKRAKEVQGLRGSGVGNKQGQAQNSSGGGGREGATNSQKDSGSMKRQMSSQSGSSCDLNETAATERSNAVSAGPGPEAGRCGAFCISCSLLLPGRHGTGKSTTTMTTAGEGENGSCDSLNNNEEQEVDEEEPGDPERPPTDQKSRKRNKQSAEGTVTTEGNMGKRLTAMAKTEISKRKNDKKANDKKANDKKANDKKANDKKAARTLSAILAAFITTWLPYNIMVLVNTFCQDCIPGTLWALGYWLCYVNSTVNPMCYALCNKTFRTTFRDILLCRYPQKKKPPPFTARKNAAPRK